MKDRQVSLKAAIDTEGLEEEIRCEICRNPMHTSRGCDGNCTYDEKLYEKITQILDRRIKHVPSAQPEPCEDAVSREAVSKWLKQYGQDVLHGKYKFSLMYIWKNLMALPSAQPVARGTNVLSNDLVNRQAAIDVFDGVKVDEEDCTEYDIGYNDGIDFVVSRLSVLPSVQPDGIPLEWINKHLEWLDNCDNDFAQLAKVSIRAMVECYGRKTGFNKQTGGD